MKLRTAGKTVYMIVILILVISVLSLIFPSDSIMRLYAVIASTMLLTLAVLIWLFYCRCPHCRRHIFFSARNIEYCPHCRRNIDTGKKKKGKSSRA